MKNYNCIWITFSGIGLSETFLLESITSLRNHANLTALCAGSKIEYEFDGLIPNGLKLDEVPHYSLKNKIIRKLNPFQPKPTQTNTRRQRAELALKGIDNGNWDFAWLHYGTILQYVAPYFIQHQIPYYIQVHGFDVTIKFADLEYKKTFVKYANQSMAVVCSSNHIRMLCILAGVSPEKVEVVHNAIDVDSLLKIKEQKTKQPSFVHLGRLTEKKHPTATLHAFKIVNNAIPDSTLTFIGEGPLRKELELAIEKLDLKDSVNLVGALPKNEALKLTAKHWIFCQHSVTSRQGDQEGFANSPAEAACLGLPVVSTLHNGIPEHVINGETGYLVKEFDYESMATYMLKLAEDTSLLREMGDKGRAHIRAFCSREQRAMRIGELLKRIKTIN